LRTNIVENLSTVLEKNKFRDQIIRCESFSRRWRHSIRTLLLHQWVYHTQMLIAQVGALRGQTICNVILYRTWIFDWLRNESFGQNQKLSSIDIWELDWYSFCFQIILPRFLFIDHILNQSSINLLFIIFWLIVIFPCYKETWVFITKNQMKASIFFRKIKQTIEKSLKMKKSKQLLTKFCFSKYNEEFIFESINTSCFGIQTCNNICMSRGVLY